MSIALWVIGSLFGVACIVFLRLGVTDKRDAREWSGWDPLAAGAFVLFAAFLLAGMNAA